MLGVMNDWRGCREPALCAIDGRLCLGGPGAVAVRVWRASRRMVVRQWPTAASAVVGLASASRSFGVVSGVPLCALRSRPSCIVRCRVCRPAADDVAPPSSRLVPLPLATTFCRPVQRSLRSLLSGWPAHDVSAQSCPRDLDLSRASGSFAACPPSQLSSTVVMALG
ncbi:hypothetical protein B0H14DRAFT_3721051 [Mycena olivaceomarginata]|nr:hypothetical protein B0H14DRAFT_3721051 [Mycena olivaceomarginata]